MVFIDKRLVLKYFLANHWPTSKTHRWVLSWFASIILSKFTWVVLHLLSTMSGCLNLLQKLQKTWLIPRSFLILNIVKSKGKSSRGWGKRRWVISLKMKIDIKFYKCMQGVRFFYHEFGQQECHQARWY